MIEFVRPPEITRDHLGIEAEGVISTNADDELFAHALETFGFLVKMGERITGSQWAERIALTYAPALGKTAASLSSIRRVMLTEKFSDDHILVDHSGAPVLRGTADQASAYVRDSGEPAATFTARLTRDCQADQLVAAKMAMATRDAAALGASLVEVTPGEKVAPNPYGLHCKVIPGVSGDLMSRMLRLLDHSPVGAETFSDEENSDYEAQCELAGRLCAFMGYSTVVTSLPEGYEPKHRAPREKSGPLSGSEVADALGQLGTDLAAHGASPGKPFFLCRSMPLVTGGSIGLQAPFESVVHPKLCGFRLPQAMVQTAVAEQLSISPEVERMR